MSFPRNYTAINDEIARIRELFSGRLDEPCFIIGNGPSSATPETVPADFPSAVVFRMNWFFLEDRPIYGHRVDGVFSSIQNDGLLQRLGEIQENGPYEIGAFFQPFLKTQDGDQVDQNRLLMPSFDHWAIIASNPTLARFMMGRPLPTQGMQVIAFAAAIGFRDLRISGIDLYAETARRYAWDVPGDVRRHLKTKDVAPGYESKHSLDLDLMFLRAVRANFDFRMRGISKMELLAPFFDKSETKIGVSKDVSPADNVKAAKGKFAYATLVDGDYIIGACALARSLASSTDVPLVAMYHDPGIGRVLSRLPNVIPRKIEPLSNPHAHGQRRFSGTYSKLRVFDLLEYDRVVFIDADCVVTKPVDDLFTTDGFCAAPNWGNEITPHFNSGVFAFSPSPQLQERVYSGITVHPSYDGGDQGFLNALFSEEWRPLPPEYNTLKRLLVRHPNLVNLSDVKILHFVGRKPWDLEADQGEYDFLAPIWLKFLQPADWETLFWLAREKLGARAGRRTSRALTGRRLIRFAKRFIPEPVIPVLKTCGRRLGVF